MAQSGNRHPDARQDARQPSQQDAMSDLERRVATLEANVKNLSERTYALETEIPPELEDHETRIAALEAGEPPDTTQPPDTEPPPSGDQTLQQLVDQGGAVTLPKANYTEECKVNKPVQLTGQPTTIDVTGLTLSNQKGIFDAQNDLELTDITLLGANVPDMNGAGVRGAIGAAIMLTDCEVHDCQMGILVSGGGVDIEVTRCKFHNNGAGDGRSHEIYCSAVSRTQYGDTHFMMTDSESICGDKSCHALKVRATSTTVRNCTFKGPTTSNGSIAGSVVDIPDGGEVLIENTTIEMMATSPTSTIFGYLTENSSQGVGTVTLRNVKIIDGRNRGGDVWARAGLGAKLVLEGCTYTAQNPPSLTGWASVSGQFTRV